MERRKVPEHGEVNFPVQSGHAKKQIQVLWCEHCRALSGTNPVESPPEAHSYVHKLYGVNSSDVNYKSWIVVCGFSSVDLKLFVPVYFTVTPLGHKHEVSLQTIVPFRDATTPYLLLTDLLQKAT